MMYVIGIIVSYLLGSIPMGLLLTRLAGKGDLRRVGSGNIGATNVMRVGGLRMAGLVWILDMAKAVAAVFHRQIYRRRCIWCMVWFCRNRWALLSGLAAFPWGQGDIIPVRHAVGGQSCVLCGMWY